MDDLTGKEAATIKLKMDNMFAVALSKNPIFHERSKHIDIMYHFIRKCLERMGASMLNLSAPKTSSQNPNESTGASSLP